MTADEEFNTIDFCRENRILSFTFQMNHTKKCSVKWSDINHENFTQFIHDIHNGFAIITGQMYIVIDFDEKHKPPMEIRHILEENCDAIEKTPGGYHFWYLMNDRTKGFSSTTNISWNGKKIEGLDQRAKGGICYVAPSWYMGEDRVIRVYEWIKGNLSTASVLPDAVYDSLVHVVPTVSVSHAETNVDDSETIKMLLYGLSMKRCNDYQLWLQVGMALKHSGYSFELWDEWSRQSDKYDSRECHYKWTSFMESTGMSRKPLTKASLFGWLKEDNYALFVALQNKCTLLQSSILSATNGSVADAFYALNPDRYVFSSVEGWYILQPNKTWLPTGSLDVSSIPNILNTIRDECCSIIIDGTTRKNIDDSGLQTRMIGDCLKKLGTAGFVKGVSAFLSGLYVVPHVEKLFNEKRHLFAFTNGVMDMNTGLFRKIAADDYITVTCGYDYRLPLNSEKEMVRAFLAKIFPHPDVLNYVLAALARTLVGVNSEQLFHVFTGMGANGKSCLMDLCKMVFGDYYMTFSVSYLTKESDGKDKPLPEFAAARYARMLVTSEPDDRDRFQINVIKNITGNEEVSFRGMYAKTVTQYVPQFKLWILTNDMPRLSKYDQAIERRMRCVHFPTRFVYHPQGDNEALRDDTLSQQFRDNDEWRYGLLGLLLDSYARSLVMPEAVKEFTNIYMLENNPVGAWLQQKYERTGRRDDVIQKSELYRAFLEDTGIHKTQKDFSGDIVKCNVNEKVIKGSRMYYGIIKRVLED